MPLPGPVRFGDLTYRSYDKVVRVTRILAHTLVDHRGPSIPFVGQDRSCGDPSPACPSVGGRHRRLIQCHSNQFVQSRPGTLPEIREDIFRERFDGNEGTLMVAWSVPALSVIDVPIIWI